MKKFLTTIVILLTIAGSSCKKGFLDLTANPNTPSTASPALLLSGALKTSADIVNGPDYAMYACWVGYMSWSTGFQANVQLEEYQFTNSDYQAVWDNNYANLSNYAALEATNSGPDYQAIAEIMSVYEWEELVDNYNNVPYTSALKGAADLTPTYQTGESIYLDLMKRLDAAITLINPASASALNPGAADVMFGGNMTSWAQFANTLKLRLALRESESTDATVQTDYATLSAAVKTTSALGYLSSTNPALVNPGYLFSDANGGQETPLDRWWGVTQTGGAETGKSEYQANTYMAHFFAVNNDPRLIEVYSASPNTEAYTVTGLQPGAEVDYQVDATGDTISIVSTVFGKNTPPFGTIGSAAGAIPVSVVGPGVLQSPTQAAAILSAPESLFLQAEGAARGLISGDPAALYNAGIAASFSYFNVSSGLSAAAYAAQPAIAYPSGGTVEQQVQAIITQKWAALAVFGAFEAWNEYRRTGYPNVPTSIYPAAPATQVTRIFYPFIEFETNEQNVQAQGAINQFTSKIFWAK
jgi:hypothetical protein